MEIMSKAAVNKSCERQDEIKCIEDKLSEYCYSSEETILAGKRG